LLLLVSTISYTQPERADIIEKKIKSVNKIVYQNGDTANKELILNYYSKTGDDSLEIYNGELAFRFVPTVDQNGRVSQLIRYDSRNREDEWHIYKYKRDGTYSIEKIAQGAGTILHSQYNKKNWCMEEEIESTYTLVYIRNVAGKTEKILLKDKGKTETIAQFYFDKNRLPIRGEGTTEGGKTVYFTYNEKELINKVTTIEKVEKGKEQTEVMLFEYEYYVD
jgi:hypothetical protein